MSYDKTAGLYHLVLPEDTCPFGLRAKQILKKSGCTLDEHILHPREEVDAFEEEQGVDATPQIFIGGNRIGGSDDFKRYRAK